MPDLRYKCVGYVALNVSDRARTTADPETATSDQAASFCETTGRSARSVNQAGAARRRGCPGAFAHRRAREDLHRRDSDAGRHRAW